MKNCNICAAAGKVAFNVLVSLDLTANVVLLGDPRETVSRRLARARTGGSRAAAVVCSAMTFFYNTVFRENRDHCTWAMTAGDVREGEVWHWSKPENES